MLNRMPADRPESARDALQVFFQNDKNPKPTMSLGKAAPPIPAGPRSRLAIPGGSTTQRAAPPKRIISDPRMAPLGYVPPVVEPPPVEPPPPPEPPPQAITAPQPLLPPEGSKPSIYTAPIEIPDNLPPTPTVGGTILVPARHYKAPPNKGKKIRAITLSVVTLLILCILGFLLSTRIKASKASQRFTILLADAAKDGTTEVLMTGPELEHFLDVAANADTEEKQKQVFQLLALAKPSDGSDFDGPITKFATTSTQLLPEVRATMLQDVLGKRMNPAMVPTLVDFSRTTKDMNSAIASLRAVRSAVGDDQFEAFFSIVQFHPNAQFRQAAEENLGEILRKSTKRGDFAKQINTVLGTTTDSKIRETLQRIKSASGG